MLNPINVSASKKIKIVPWDESFPFLLATLCNRYLPRGKGAIPRLVGKYFFQHKLVCISTVRQASLLITGDSLDLGSHVFNKGGRWTEPVIRACIASLNEGDTFLDIGANLGVVGIDLCQYFRGRLKCFAFEPQERLCEALALSIAQNNFTNFKVFEAAIGAATEIIELYFASHSGLVSAVTREAGARSFLVNCYSLDDLIYIEKLPPPNVIKVDTEGGELNVFKGGVRMLREFAPTIVFESDDNMIRWGYSREDVVDLLSSCAPYRFYIITRDEAVSEYSPMRHSQQLIADVVATTNQGFMGRYRDGVPG